MSEKELEVLQKLAEAWNLYIQLPKRSIDDNTDFITGIHNLERIVMARIARYHHPETFNQNP